MYFLFIIFILFKNNHTLIKNVLFFSIGLFFVLSIMEIMALETILRQFSLMIAVYVGKLNWPT